ncbi:MAG: SusC/RagA family TonB-linked outer membrane protein [Prolixibacteraceae bacterium]|nr:SusC/RagA family TonB-linked outer membrane protein [Prolixibacteraceae bacterium]
MKLNFFIMLVFSIHVSASVTAQKTKLDLKMSNASFSEILDAIEKQSEVYFFFNKDQINENQRINVDFESKTVEEILAGLGKDLSITYEIIGKNIIIKPKDTSISNAVQQVKSIKGKVTNPAGEAIPGATVAVEGTTKGTITDFDGNYSLTDLPAGATIVFSFVGMKTQEIKVADQSTINVVLQEEALGIDEVVVTALGLTREQKSLGYAVSKVESEELTQVASRNWLNGMSGKVAGLTMSGASSGPIGSMRVTLRGDQSLNYGSNEALFIVDGVPIRSGTTATSSSSSYTNSGSDFPVDFGNGASDINPEDIESVSVLKGPAATALYGSRAANGAIVITTKSGRKDKGIGVVVNSSVVVENAGYWPEFQTEYGSGSDMGLNEYNFWTLTEAQTGQANNPKRNLSRYAWGEKFSADKLRYQYNGKNWETGMIEKTPFIYQDDWFTGIFQTGVTYNNSVSVSGSNGEGTNVRFSVNDTRNEWILPNTGFQKQSVSFSFDSPINKWIKFNSKVNYYRTDSDNMPMAGYHQTTVMYNLMWGYNSNSMNDWKSEYFEGRFNAINRNATISENGNSLVFAGTGSYNPYRVLYEELNTVDKDRVFGSVGFSIDLAKNLTLNVKSGMDFGYEFRTQRKPKMTFGWENGFYREQGFMNFESNSDFLLQYKNDFVDNRLSLTGAFGGNNMVTEYNRTTVQLNELDIPGVYHTSNVPSGINPTPDSYRSKKMINSLYGFFSLGWDDTFFLDITGRNDWSSTLSRGNWSYFYPSIAGSVLIDKLFDFQTNLPAVSFAKMRLSWANVGNDTSPYSLDQYYSASAISGGYTLPGTIPDPMVKPENVESWELGLEAKFLRNRLGFDMALYSSSTTNQIVSVDIDPIVGASSMKINAGEISNKGIELAVNATPVKTRDFTWNLNLNWSKNINKLVSLQDGWDPTTPLETDMGTTIGGRLHVYSYIGEEMHQLYGFALRKAPEGSYYVDSNGNQVDCSGQVVLGSDGLPTLTQSADNYLGKVNPDWRGGLNTSFRYKNFTLNMTFTYQWGGNRFSVTNGILSYQGKLKNSLEGRYDGIVAEGVNILSTNPDGSAVCQVNNTVTSNIYTYYQARALDRYNGEAHTFDTSFLKFKEARLEYDLPKSLCTKTGFLQGANVAIFATNIFSWDNWPQFDPEGGMLTGTNVFNGIEAGTFPMTRTFGLNLKLSF